MIDLHTHTNESDGSYTPLELVDRALAIGLEALGISDHDTFAATTKRWNRLALMDWIWCVVSSSVSA